MRQPWESPPQNVTSVALGGFVTLTNVGATYDATSAGKGLGFAVVDLTNCRTIDVAVFVSKVGSGTQDWQLWNETDGSQLGVVSDAGAAGDKTLTLSVNLVGLGLSGMKRLRLRVRSSTAADDPLYYGSCLTIY